MSEHGRLPLLAPAELAEAQRVLQERIVGGKRAGQPFQASTADGRLLGPFNALLYTPELGLAVQEVGEQLRFSGTLPARLRELVILTVGADSVYEWYAHSRVARTVGVTEAELEALAAGGTPETCDSREAVAIEVAKALPGEVDAACYRRARAEFSEAELVELSVLAGYYRLLAGILATFAVPAPR
ncbi:carboxymuconolactone decarboxylase family protein [Tamaricihabitans halophyticus]|uniref:carboxymuconolactone decarboxylase family protein n=1 Tax=Tamaricihabitans halophyticus TaxID=1262583 RepID=UPI0014054357|nr:carboxymuconolactone decarboxylase family protein [Tamaricihabitans halophyticus]